MYVGVFVFSCQFHMYVNSTDIRLSIVEGHAFCLRSIPCMYASTCVHVYICMYVCMFVSIFACVYVFV